MTDTRKSKRPFVRLIKASSIDDLPLYPKPILTMKQIIHDEHRLTPKESFLYNTIKKHQGSSQIELTTMIKSGSYTQRMLYKLLSFKLIKVKNIGSQKLYSTFI